MKILMVCLGNICRSPMAEGVLRYKLFEQKINKNIEVDSAGTIAMHEGEHPDRRAIKTAKKHGVDIGKLRARHFSLSDFDCFDKIIVMDESNFNTIISLARDDEDKRKVEMLLNYSRPQSNASLQDPYYGDMDGFDSVYGQIDIACDALIQLLVKEINL